MWNLRVLAALAAPLLFLSTLVARGAVAYGPASAQNPASEARATAPAVLVFPFEHEGRAPKLDWLGEGMAELTIERLNRAGVNAYSREERLAALEKLGLPASSRFSRAMMIKIAREMDADEIIFGEYSSVGDRVTVSVRILRMNPPEMTLPFQASGTVADLMDWQGKLSWKLLCAMDRSPADSAACGPAHLDRARFLNPTSLPRADAFEAYVRGLLSTGPKGDDSGRLRFLHEAARLDPTWVEPVIALGQTYFSHRDCESALLWLSRVPPATPYGPEASFDAGICHLLRNDPGRAEAAFGALLELARPGTNGISEMPEVLNNLGVARMRLGKNPEAQANLERAVELDPAVGDYWFNLGLARLKAGDAQGAVQPLREALSRRAGDDEARGLLAAALEQTGEKEEANQIRNGVPDKSDATSVATMSLKPDDLAKLSRVQMRWHNGVFRSDEDPAPASSRKQAGTGEAQ